MLTNEAEWMMAATVEAQEDSAFVEGEEMNLSLKRRCPGLTFFTGKGPPTPAAVGSG